jgi:serine/threonine protein kinase
LTQQRYHLLYLLDQGGAGQVFKALHLNNGQPVALKLWHPLTVAIDNQPFTPNTHFIQHTQFTKEIRLCSQLQHPTIVTLLHQGQADNGQYFAVFELLPGLTLKELLIQKDALTVVETGEIMAQVLSALAWMHSQGIAHCDLKPQNIMVNHVGKNTQVTLLDFGNAAVLDKHGSSQFLDIDTLPSDSCLCSPAYSAPEQLRRALPSTQFDLYAWGLIFLECLTGQIVMRGHNVAEICQQQWSADEVPLPVGLLGQPLATLLRRVLHKEPWLREASACVLLRDFLPIDLLGIVGDFRGVKSGRRSDADGVAVTQACFVEGS